MELVITRQALQFFQSILLGISAGALYDILRPFRAMLPRLTGVLDFLYGLILTLTALAFLMRPADGELRGYMLLGIAGGLILFYGLLSRPLRPVWQFWAVSVAAAVKISLTPLLLLKVFLKKSVRAGKNLFYFSEKCYTIRRGFQGRRARAANPASGRGGRAGKSRGTGAGNPAGKAGGRAGKSRGTGAGNPAGKAGGRVEKSRGTGAGNPAGKAGGRAGKSRGTGAGKSGCKTGGVTNGPKKKQSGTKAASC